MSISKNSRIFVAGHKGLVGSSIVRRLKDLNYKYIITKSKKKLDLKNINKVDYFFKKEKIEYVILAAAKVGGIMANLKNGAEFLTENIQIQTNVILSAHKHKIKNLIFLGSSCIYPKLSKQPIKEEYLLTGKLEATNEAYAIAKITGVKMCEKFNSQYRTNYKCLMPSNLFGPNDNYNLNSSHFLPAVIKKLYLAKKKKKKSIIFWGTGKAKREITYVDEVADACIYFLDKKTKHTLINIGSGYEKTIKQYINLVSKELKLKIKIKFNNNKLLDGTMRKIVDCKIAKSYGWKPKYQIEKYLKFCIQDYILNSKKYKN